MSASLTFLTPWGALAALAAFLPLAAAARARVRVASVRRVLKLRPPAREARAIALAAPAATVLLLGLAAAQPALSSTAFTRARLDAQALFVLDISRSMAASSRPSSPTRLDRAIAAALRLRAAISAVPAGVATLTDRVLPDLLPVPDVPAFDATLARAVGIEQPPPQSSGARATSFSALAAVQSGNYFTPAARRRVVVLLTDGESSPVDSGAVARAFRRPPGISFVAVRIWNSAESIFGPAGRPEPAYRPDPTGLALLDSLALAVGGRAYDESALGAAAGYLARVVGTGPTRRVALSQSAPRPLAPYLAALALVPLVGIFRLRRGA